MIRWPKRTGILLIVAASLLLSFFYSGGQGSALPLTTLLSTDSMLILPLYVCAIALIKEITETDESMAQDNKGIAIGLVIGIAVGVAVDNIAVGIAVGIVFGALYDRKQESE